MVQSLVAPEGDYDADRLWKEISTEQLMDSKLKCVFELPVDNNTVIDLSSSKIKQTDGTVSDITATKQEIAQLNAEDKPLRLEAQGSGTFDYSKLSDEIRKLREEESQLRQENLELKDQILKLKMASHSQSSAAGGAHQSQYQNPYAPPATTTSQQPPIMIAIAVAVAILGLLIGKFIL